VKVKLDIQIATFEAHLYPPRIKAHAGLSSCLASMRGTRRLLKYVSLRI
jgi:hypothetical protein